MTTGRTPGLGYRLFTVAYKRLNMRSEDLRTQCIHIDAAYCIDAPDLMPAGSTESFWPFGWGDSSGWTDIPTMIDREGEKR